MGKISTASLLGILFVALKLTHNIGWSWLWVLSPFWIGAAVCAFWFVVLAVIGIVIVWANR